MEKNPDFKILQLHVSKIKGELAKVVGEPGFVHNVVASPVEQNLQHRLFVVPCDPGQEAEELIASHRREPARHTEIDQRNAVARQVHHIAGVWIGVEETVDQDHLENSVRAPCGEQLPVKPRSNDGVEVIASNALDVLLHVHDAARPLRINVRDEDVRVAGKIASEPFGMSRLDGQIELAIE